MSNCIKIRPCRIHLEQEFFDYSKLVAGTSDLDGNSIEVDEDGVSFIPAEFTTWRELRSFVRDAISKAVVAKNEVRVDVPKVRDEYDDFTKQFTMTIWFNAPTWEQFAR